jgi:hypothetical protein
LSGISDEALSRAEFLGAVGVGVPAADIPLAQTSQAAQEPRVRVAPIYMDEKKGMTVQDKKLPTDQKVNRGFDKSDKFMGDGSVKSQKLGKDPNKGSGISPNTSALSGISGEALSRVESLGATQ